MINHEDPSPPRCTEHEPLLQAVLAGDLRPDDAAAQPLRHCAICSRRLDRMRRVLAQLERIGGIEAEIIRLKHFAGLTFKEISERTSTPENTAKARYYRGIERLGAMSGPGSDDE